MDNSNLWLDPKEVRRLAEQLMRPGTPQKKYSEDPGFNKSFEGFINEEQKVSIGLDPNETQRSIPSSKAETAIETTDFPIVEAVPEIPLQELPPETLPEKISATRLLERIQIFRNWMIKNFKASEVFILGTDGKIVFDDSNHGKMHVIARNLAASSKAVGNVHVKVGPSSTLEIISSDTPIGKIILGLTLPEPLPPQHVGTITKILVQTVSPA